MIDRISSKSLFIAFPQTHDASHVLILSSIAYLISLCCARYPHSYGKRDLCLWQKRPISPFPVIILSKGRIACPLTSSPQYHSSSHFLRILMHRMSLRSLHVMSFKHSSSHVLKTLFIACP